ncbi:DUF4974 domain-containing protein [Olivibacter ginsenosidimutans]|uniref:DUF4974 domain-containing protein n=1 Tax=Olivibacter ginsenosidimutans TaxID=1176537 RepID=A0ABP9ARH7_9SPHI
MLNPEEYLALYEKYQAGMCSPEELQALYAYRDRFKLTSDEEVSAEEEEIGHHVYQEIWQELSKKQGSLIKPWLAIAASIALLIGVWTVFRWYGNPTPTTLKTADNHHTIKPGKNTATLTLANGKSIRLDEAHIGEIVKEAGVHIAKTADGQWQYTVQQQDQAAAPSYQTIETPKGGQYQILLPDSTKVWLNAASSLRYPTNFIGKERVVELTGEAYFEVTKRKNQSFRVSTVQQNVNVLGTTFNITAYAEDQFTTTVVASGAVSVHVKGKPNVKRVLQAGDQSELNSETSEMKLSHANIQQILAWKNGYFIFENDPLPVIMDKIARWYNIEVSYIGDVKQKKFGGTYNRTKDFLDLLKGLEFSGNVHFKVEGRRVTVMP